MTKATERNDSPFWDHCRTMEVPDTLPHKMDLYRSNGRIFRDAVELFTEFSWLQVMHGHGLLTKGYAPFADFRSKADVIDFVSNVESVIRKRVDVMRTHAEFIGEHCAAKSV